MGPCSAKARRSDPVSYLLSMQEIKPEAGACSLGQDAARGRAPRSEPASYRFRTGNQGAWRTASALSARVKPENVFKGRIERQRNPKGELQRRSVFSRFDSDDGLPCRANARGKVRLCHPGGLAQRFDAAVNAPLIRHARSASGT